MQELQTVLIEAEQSEHPRTLVLQQADFWRFRKPTKQPVHFLGESKSHLLQSANEKVQQANLSILNVKPALHVVHLLGSALVQSIQPEMVQHAIAVGLRTAEEQLTHLSRFVVLQSLHPSTFEVQQSVFA